MDINQMTPDELAQVITPDLLRESAQQFSRQLIQMPFQVLMTKTGKYITILPGVRNQITFGELDGDAQLAPWSANNRAAADYSIKGRTLVVYPGNCAKDFQSLPLLHSIYGESIAQGVNISKQDIARKLVSLFAAKIGMHINDVVFTGGVRNVNGHTTADLFDSFGTIVAAEITAGNIAANKGNYISLGAIDSTNAVAKLKEAWRAADNMLKGLGNVYMYISPEVYDAYVDDYQARHGALPYNTSFDKTYLEGSNGRCEFAVLDNMAGSNYIFITVKQNLILGTDIFGQENHVNIGCYAPWVNTFEYAGIYGEQIRSISKEVFMVADITASEDSGDDDPEPEPSPVTLYTLTWKIGDDTFKTEQLAAGAAVSEPDPAPEAQEGKTFAWSNVPTHMPAENTTVNGAYTDL